MENGIRVSGKELREYFPYGEMESEFFDMSPSLHPLPRYCKQKDGRHPNRVVPAITNRWLNASCGLDAGPAKYHHFFHLGAQ